MWAKFEILYKINYFIQKVFEHTKLLSSIQVTALKIYKFRLEWIIFKIDC